MSEQTFNITGEVVKVNEELGLVLGWAIVCSEKGVDYFDTQGDHVTEKGMFGAAVDFFENSRVAGHMHEKVAAARGVVSFGFPLTDEVATAFGITCEKRGLMIAMKPDADMLKRFKDGELTGFSIGGLRGEDQEVD